MHFAAILDLGLVVWFMVLAGAELIAVRSRGPAKTTGDARLVTNFGLGALVLFLNSVLPLVKIGSSLLDPWLGGGLCRLLALPWAVALLVFVFADSFATYWTHRMMHAVPIFWRIHRVHHADAEVDVSTSLRNHPLELLVTVPVSVTVIISTGAPPTAVIAAQAIAVAAAIWQHADIEVPRLEGILSRFLITPLIHRVHHNPERRLHDSNYGELITLWDRLFGTFNPGRGRGRVGLEGRVGRENGLLKQIWSPVYAA